MKTTKTELGVSHLDDEKLSALRNQLRSFVSGAATVPTLDEEAPVDSHSSHTDTDGWI